MPKQNGTSINDLLSQLIKGIGQLPGGTPESAGAFVGKQKARSPMQMGGDIGANILKGLVGTPEAQAAQPRETTASPVQRQDQIETSSGSGVRNMKPISATQIYFDTFTSPESAQVSAQHDLVKGLQNGVSGQEMMEAAQAQKDKMALEQSSLRSVNGQLKNALGGVGSSIKDFGQKFSENLLAFNNAETFTQKKELETVKSNLRKEELNISGALELQKALATKGLEGLPADQAGKFSLLMEGKDNVDTIDELLGKGGRSLLASGKFSPDFLKSGDAASLDIAIKSAIDNRTRLETGAAMAPKELEREANKFKPRVGESVKAWKARLGRNYSFFERALNIADPQGIHRARAGASSNSNESELQALLAEKQKRKG